MYYAKIITAKLSSQALTDMYEIFCFSCNVQQRVFVLQRLKKFMGKKYGIQLPILTKCELNTTC